MRRHVLGSLLARAELFCMPLLATAQSQIALEDIELTLAAGKCQS